MQQIKCIFDIVFTNSNKAKTAGKKTNRFILFSVKRLYRTMRARFDLSGYFNLIDKQRLGDSRKCDNDDLEQLLAENLARRRKKRLQLGVMQRILSKCLHDRKRSKKKENVFRANSLKPTKISEWFSILNK